ncbi:MAG: ABC transporter substrate-binding protein [Oscillospiraceae bacterium]
MIKRKGLVILLATMLVISSLTGCKKAENNEQSKAENSSKVESSQVESSKVENEEKAKFSIDHAEQFDIEYMDNNVKLVTDSEKRKLLLVPNDVEIPTGYEDAKLIRTPLSKVLYSSTTNIGFLKTFQNDSIYDSIGAVTTDVSSWKIPQIVERMESGKIKYISQENGTAGNIEQITDLKPDFVFSGGGDQMGADLRAQLDEVSINYFVETSWLEKDNAASLEWIKLFGAFYNLDQEATDIYNKKIARMAELDEMVKSASKENAPVVAYGMLFDGVVYTKGGSSKTAKEIEKIGGVYALKDLEGEDSIQINMEEFFAKAKDADILIYSSQEQYTPSKEALLALDPLMGELKAFKNDKIYVFDDEYYMNSAASDEKFEDYVAIIQPELLSGHTLKHYVKLADK